MYSAGRLDTPMSIIYFLLFYVFINYMLVEMMVALIVEQSQLSEKRREALQFEQYTKGVDNKVALPEAPPMGGRLNPLVCPGPGRDRRGTAGPYAVHDSQV
jgi:hypothetical protein